MILESGRSIATWSSSGKAVNAVNSVDNETSLKTSLFVERKVNGVLVKDMLFETGSVITLCISNLWKGLQGMGLRLLSTRREFTVANGAPLHIFGAARMRVQLAGITALHPVLISMDILHDFLVGNDFIDAYRCDILNSVGMFSAGGSTVPLHKKVLGPSVLSIVLSKDWKLELNEAALLPGEIDDPEGEFECDEELLVEPNTAIETRTSVVLASALIKLQPTGIPILMINLSPLPLQLKQGMTLGFLRKIQLPIMSINAVQEGVQGLAESGIEKAKLQISGHLTSKQRAELDKLLNEYADIFSSVPNDLGRTNLAQHRIDTGGAPAIRLAPRRLDHQQKEEVHQEVTRMVDAGIATP